MEHLEISAIRDGSVVSVPPGHFGSKDRKERYLGIVVRLVDGNARVKWTDVALTVEPIKVLNLEKKVLPSSEKPTTQDEIIADHHEPIGSSTQDRIKDQNNEEEVLRLNKDAEHALEAEQAAELEMEKAELELGKAMSDEQQEKAKKVRQTAKKTVLKYKEKRLRPTLKVAVILRSKPRIDVGVKEAKELLPEIPTIRTDIEIAEKVSESIQCGNELEEAMAERDLQGIESSVETIKEKGYENDHTEQLLGAEHLAQKLRRLEKLKKDIMALDQRTISEIRSYKKPLAAIQDVMIATYIILGYDEKELKEWKYIQALLGRTGKEGLKLQCTKLDASTIDTVAALLATSKYLSRHDLGTVTDFSHGAATFYVWSTAMIEENGNWHQDSDFREKHEEKRRREEHETKQLVEERKKQGRKPLTSKATQKK